MSSGRLHDAGLAGRWYPADAADLARQVDRLLQGSAIAGTVALIVPHAGYAYSGRAAGRAYATVRGVDLDRVVLLAPSHYSEFDGARTLEVRNWHGFATPLGAVTIDAAAVDELLRCAAVDADDEPFAREHSLEIQLPFLRRVLPGVAVVPLLIGRVHGGDRERLAGVLASLQGSRTLFVVSSDFTHYGARFHYLPFPPQSADAVRRGLQQLDGGAIDAICAGDAARFAAYASASGATICGRRPIELFLALEIPRGPGELLTYSTSLDVTGDYWHCVSYAAIRFAATP